MIDLHVHTSMSDGTCPPERVVKMAREKGLRAIAITDHDTVDGVPRARQAGMELGVEIIPGVEMSTEWPSGIMHILGYFIDIRNERLLQALHYLRSGRMERVPKIVEKLRACNVVISADEVRREAVGGAPGRPHIAEIMVREGYVRTIQEAFDRYLRKGAPAYVEKQKMSPQRAIEIILEADGAPVLAHPYSLNLHTESDMESVLTELISYGLAGVEVYYPRHTTPQIASYHGLAKKFHLAVTGGTDFHGANKPDIELGAMPGMGPLSYRMVEELKRTHRLLVASKTKSGAAPSK